MYANGFQVILGPLDVRLLVMETAPASPDEIIDRQIASIIMTPETLKLLASSIGIFVKAYEDNYGKIRDFPVTQSVALQAIHAPLQKEAKSSP